MLTFKRVTCAIAIAIAKQAVTQWAAPSSSPPSPRPTEPSKPSTRPKRYISCTEMAGGSIEPSMNLIKRGG